MEIEFFTERREPIRGGSLKDPSFRHPTKLISIAFRKSLRLLKPNKAFLWYIRSLYVDDKPLLCRIMKQP